ncbi:hypothetical protein KV572_02615 [Pseudomonas yamanorum]|uniref:hypothetical protein n=1 Tax=Pseudomonas yamanorum TaxID=515393 RepID=UPI001C466D30|nr:hypothetical protein [Pseudomonas yamanorum]MBV6659805.1 hypothetical protein [Pseudomonas yamanorum]
MSNRTDFKAFIESNMDLIDDLNISFRESKFLSKRIRNRYEHNLTLSNYIEEPPVNLSNRTITSYKAAIRHFQFECGLRLPASPESVMFYLKLCSAHYAPDTLKLRLSALSHWHKFQLFVDPTEDCAVKSLMYQITLMSPHVPERTESFTLEHLKSIDIHLAAVLSTLSPSSQRGKYLRALRDRAIFLIAFWRALGTTQLGKINVRDILIVENDGLYLTSLDRSNTINTSRIAWRDEFCAAGAVQEWIESSTFLDDALFQKVKRNGELTGTSLSEKSIIPILQQRANEAGVCVNIGAHSFRRGFGEWARDSGWDLQSILDYVGWNGLNRHLSHLSKKNL